MIFELYLQKITFNTRIYSYQFPLYFEYSVMKKRTYAALILIMLTALLGIMLMQILWVNKGIEEREKSFANTVHLALGETAKGLREKEQDLLYDQLGTLKDDVNKKSKKQSFSLIKEDSLKKRYYIYNQEVLVKESNIPLNYGLGSSKDSLKIIDVISGRTKGELSKLPNQITIKTLTLGKYDSLTSNNITIDRYITTEGSSTPIDQRISLGAIDSVLSKELKRYQVNTRYEYAILNKDSTQTKLYTKNFKLGDHTYSVPLFFDNDDTPKYLAAIYFPNQSQWIKTPIIGQFVLAALLMTIVLVVFGVSLYYLRKQRRVADVKNDFINNMTHEFKTPIATINVAVDALKSPAVLRDPEKIKHYANLIKQEGKRLNSHVEMVLRISKLEKNQIDLNIQKVDLNELVSDAIDHIRLIVEDRNGTIFEKYSDEVLYVNVDAFHLGNIILNILDNANKYSHGEPQISVSVYQEKGLACVSVSDKGMGMSKSVQKKIFEQFYREEGGNVHNIKGHGLGLAYTKKIIELHNGTVVVQSEKGKGSTFTLKVPI